MRISLTIADRQSRHGYSNYCSIVNKSVCTRMHTHISRIASGHRRFLASSTIIRLFILLLLCAAIISYQKLQIKIMDTKIKFTCLCSNQLLNKKKRKKVMFNRACRISFVAAFVVVACVCATRRRTRRRRSARPARTA